jgi:hypothetical protein
MLKPGDVKLINGKRPNAALGATWTAHQPLSTLRGGIGERSINNLHQLLVASRILAHSSTILHGSAKKEAGHAAPPGSWLQTA